MIISSVQNAASYAAASKRGGTSSSFQATLAETTGATSDTTSSSSSSTKAASGDPAVKTFTDYMKKTPGERMFDSWLSSQKITSEQFKAMSPADQQKLLAEFKDYMKQQMTKNTNTGSSSGSVDIMA